MNPLSPSLLKVCTQITDEIYNLPISIDFREPVNINLYPDYKTIIKKPMDLGTVKKKLKNQEYKYFSEWKNDMLLIFENSITYNHRETLFRQLAEYLMDKLQKRIALIKILNRQTYEESLRFCYRQILHYSKKCSQDFPLNLQGKCPNYTNHEIADILNKYQDKNEIKQIICDTGSSNALKKNETNINIDRFSRQTLDVLYTKYGPK